MASNQNFSARDYGNMLMCYGEARGNARQALRIYVERYPGIRHPTDPRVITRAYQRVLDNQPVVPQIEGAGRPIRNRAADNILAVVRQNPRLGIRTAARLLRNRYRTRVSHWTVHRILRRDRQRAYRTHKVQALLPIDRVRRVTYCRWLQQQHVAIPTFAANVIWTDESTFTRNGMWNRRNSHIWAHSNPFALQQTGHQTRWSVNVWAGIFKNRVIGPIFLPERLNGPRYHEFLRTTLEEILDEMPVAHFRDAWYQHDGAPPHVTLPVRSWLTGTFGNQWIGRFGPQPWPARSPDLTPLDFFLWGYVKDKVFVTECNTAAEMRDRIINVFATLRAECVQDPTFMPRVHAETLRRARICEHVGGGHFEPYLIRNERA